MIRMAMSVAFAGMLLVPWAAHAGDALQEGRSAAGACSPRALVCAVLKDGSMKATDECAARREGSARILPGDCFDAD